MTISIVVGCVAPPLWIPPLWRRPNVGSDDCSSCFVFGWAVGGTGGPATATKAFHRSSWNHATAPTFDNVPQLWCLCAISPSPLLGHVLVGPTSHMFCSPWPSDRQRPSLAAARGKFGLQPQVLTGKMAVWRLNAPMSPTQPPYPHTHTNRVFPNPLFASWPGEDLKPKTIRSRWKECFSDAPHRRKTVRKGELALAVLHPQ